MYPEQILTSMRAGTEQPDAAIQAFVDAVVDERMSRPQIAAWLAYAFTRGLSDQETVALTRGMSDSGDRLEWEDGPLLTDKHSTGGVGDKVSLILAPLWAELGWRVPMISGRGLGHTGGTLDKLESISGYRTDLEESALRIQLADLGCFISGQTGRLAPADRVLYALRNETSTVESIPLIVGSILSKKIAAGVKRLVLDVKAGSGAFMKDVPRATALATALVRVAKGAGLDCVALLTNMDRPLGLTIGNALEVEESVDTLKGGGPQDLIDITLALTDHPRAAEVLASGTAYARFERMVAAQGGDVSCLGRVVATHANGVSERVVTATRSGSLHRVDAGGLGWAAFRLGAGRRRAEDPVDFGVGLRLHAQIGDTVEAGQPLVTVLHREGHALEQALAGIDDAVVIGDGPADVSPLVYDRIG